MPYILARHKVEDYAKWKPLFDENVDARSRVYILKILLNSVNSGPALRIR
jgi:hypothetical protein